MGSSSCGRSVIGFRCIIVRKKWNVISWWSGRREGSVVLLALQGKGVC
jgi:hypothetical protein